MRFPTFSAIVISFAYLVGAETPPGFSPAVSTQLSVSFASNTLTPGSHMPLNVTAKAPAVQPLTNYSLILMIDLDTPFGAQNRSLAPFLHWISTPSSHSNSSVVAYGPPAPPPGSPDHRFVLLSYNLPANHTGNFTMPLGFESVGTTLMSKANFNLEGFLQGAGLTGPTAGNWFTVSPAVTGDNTYESGGAISAIVNERKIWVAAGLVTLVSGVASVT